MTSAARAALDDLQAALRLLSRLPAGSSAARVDRTSDALRFAPLVGVSIACLQAAAMAVLIWSRVPAFAIGGCGLAVSLLLTGALHEDGLADVADGFGGGRTRERKLAIMRDSRIGTYGTAALICSLLVRAACLASLAGQGQGPVLAALLIAATVSRSAMLLPVALLPPARPDGLGRSVREGAVTSILWSAGLTALIVIVVTWAAALPWARVAAASAGAAAGAGIVTALARRQIGGMTGDVAGAAQQVAEAAVLLALSAA